MSTKRSEERRKGKEKEVLKVEELADTGKKCVASGISQNSPTLQKKGEDRQWLKELVSV